VCCDNVHDYLVACLIENSYVDTLCTLCDASVRNVAMAARYLMCLLTASAKTAHAVLANAVALQQLLRCSASVAEDDSREEAAWALARLSSEATGAELIAAHPELIMLLFRFVERPLVLAQLQAAWALANLVLSEQARELVLHEHGCGSRGIVPCLLAVVKEQMRMAGVEDEAKQQGGSNRNALAAEGERRHTTQAPKRPDATHGKTLTNG